MVLIDTLKLDQQQKTNIIKRTPEYTHCCVKVNTTLKICNLLRRQDSLSCGATPQKHNDNYLIIHDI